jgi:phosphatidylglycerol lysyltransferase
MEGKKRQNLRTARNNLVKKGYQCRVVQPPVPGNILQQLKAVSNDWLERLGEEELVFSQGMFLESEVVNHTVLYLEAPDGKIVAFLDLIPDYDAGEARYDLIRKLADEYSGCLDMLMVELIEYCRAQGYQRLNMGLAPMSGIDAPRDFGERTIKFAYERIGRFRHYKGLRFFKEKFDPRWENKYLIYAHHFDLVLLPAALNKVMKEF